MPRSEGIETSHIANRSLGGDCLQKEQLTGWFIAVRQGHNPVIAAYLQALLLTCARRNELAGLKWDDVDFRWKSLTIRDKVEGERTIPLTPFVESLLQFHPGATNGCCLCLRLHRDASRSHASPTTEPWPLLALRA